MQAHICFSSPRIGNVRLEKNRICVSLYYCLKKPFDGYTELIPVTVKTQVCELLRFILLTLRFENEVFLLKA